MAVKQDVEMMVTLLPSFPHFQKFANDSRLGGIRLNSAMLTNFDLDKELALIPKNVRVPLYFDIKGRQLRITKVHDNDDFLDFSLNHPINVRLPVPILFKGGEDSALLICLGNGDGTVPEDLCGPSRLRSGVSSPGGGKTVDPNKWYSRLAVQQGPKYLVHPGESIHIRDGSMRAGGNQFVDAELKKIEQVKSFGLTRWFLSYVQSQRDVDEFLELVGKHEEVILKIESKQGMEYVAREFKKRDNLRLCAAKGDLYVELDQPHEILHAQKLIIEKDPKAVAGSRMMLSVINKVPRIVDGADGRKVIKYSIETSEVPSDADFEQLAWLYEIGYRSFMLCDELCLRDNLLSLATNALDAFRSSYPR